MKKITVIVGLLSLVFIVGVVNTVSADSNAAIVMKDLDHPYGCSYQGGLYTQDQIHTGATSSNVVKLICHFEVPDGYLPSGKAIHVEGFSCGIYLPDDGIGIQTMDSRIDINKNRATMECWIKTE
jgi:hypothetical protein